MCGITGVVLADRSGVVDPAMLRRMTEILRYRGPDSQGFFAEPGVGLGIRRLAINDLAGGDQPISNEDGTLTVVCNGEIYNFVELRQELQAAGHRFRTGSDVEVIVHLYEEEGPACVHRLRGMFAFALWDGRRRRLMLARDRLGIKPLHYAVTGEACYFGSELKSILVADRVEREIDLRALEDVFAWGFVRAPRTMFARIRRLLPGHYLLYREGDLSVHRYWEPRFPAVGEESPFRDAAEWAEALREKLRETVQIHMRSDVPVGAWLRDRLPLFASELLSPDALREKGYFDPAFVAGLLERHRAGEEYGHQLFGVLAVQQWDELFRRGCRPSSVAATEERTRCCSTA